MRRIWTLLIAGLMMGAVVTPAQAKVVSMEKGTYTLKEGEVINDDLYVTAETVEIAGVVEGDVYIGAGVVRFTGRTTGDLVIGSGEVRVSGEVGDDLWIGAGNVYLMNVKVGDGVIVGAGSVTIDEDSSIGGSLLAGTGMLDNRAVVGRNLMAGAGLVRLNAPIGGELRVGGETIELGEKTEVRGDLTYMTEEELMMSEGATVAGQTIRVDSHYPTQVERAKWEGKMAGMWKKAGLSMNVLGFFAALLVGMMMLWLMKKPTVAIAEQIEKNFLASLGWGLLVLVLSLPALVLMTITVVGAPLAMILAAILVVDIYLAKIFASLALGRVIQKQFGWKQLQLGAVLTIGLGLYYLLRMVPVLMIFVRLVALIAGMGGIWLQLKSTKK